MTYPIDEAMVLAGSKRRCISAQADLPAGQVKAGPAGRPKPKFIV
jgi:hypothetical protein